MEKKLSVKQQEVGRKYYFWFTRLNAISFGCLAESILILYAIKNGADDFLVGLLTSFFYLTMPLMLIGKQLVGKFGAARSFALCWALRNSSAALMILVPFVIKMTNPTIGLSLLLIGAFNFFTFRNHFNKPS